jgi:signal peptidase II
MFIIFALILANYGCDQVTKSMARKQIPDNERIEVIGERFILTKAENTGMMLGSGSNLDPTAKTIIVYILPTVMLTVLFFFTLFQTKLNHLMVFSLTFIIGGGFGNIIDRIRYGSVTDFLHMDFGMVQTGIFNLADVSIMIGAILIMLISIFQKRLTI